MSKATDKKKDGAGGIRNGKPPYRTRKISTGGSPNKRNRKLGIIRKGAKFRKSGESSVRKHELECRIYLDTNDVKIAENYYKNLIHLLEEYDFIKSREFPAEKGSWLKKFWIQTKGFLTGEDVTDRLEKVERGIELHYIDKTQSEVDLNEAQALSTLLDSTKDISNFSTLVGSLLFAKATPSDGGEPMIFARTLTQEQLKIVNDNPALINQPYELIMKMEEEKAKAIEKVKSKRLAGN